jgi:hypothetical protein
MPTPAIQRRWKNLPGEPVGDAGDPYTGYDRFGRTEQMRWIKPHTRGGGFDTQQELGPSVEYYSYPRHHGAHQILE